MPVMSPKRMVDAPRCISTRAPSSAQSLSPVVIGRLTTAETQSGSPAGWKETEPRRWLIRATRPDGSLSAATARLAKLTVNNSAAKKSVLVRTIIPIPPGFICCHLSLHDDRSSPYLFFLLSPCAAPIDSSVHDATPFDDWAIQTSEI